MDTLKLDKPSEEVSVKDLLSRKEALEQDSFEELNELKAWLFDENNRITAAQDKLNQMEKKFSVERKQFQDEMKDLNQKLAREKKRLKEDMAFFDKKMEILKSGFSQLDMDKRKFEKDKVHFIAEKEAYARESSYGRYDTVEYLFRGVSSPLSLKKRYKDLIKMFHPDNIAGDHEMVLVINKYYEKMRNKYSYERQA
ncbi:MAG: hypothetical protein FWG91_11390 [Lachnospiraceae bacterium]|nr:hypothetical protein [Lachnospiraceae bacterium]